MDIAKSSHDCAKLQTKDGDARGAVNQEEREEGEETRKQEKRVTATSKNDSRCAIRIWEVPWQNWVEHFK